jgi:hypothetical protein
LNFFTVEPLPRKTVPSVLNAMPLTEEKLPSVSCRLRVIHLVAGVRQSRSQRRGGDAVDVDAAALRTT